ncbi:MAG: uncharacterized protein KVP18_002608 [Porospora cf. gigantea A]|uniref:uncharacterized protein n=1 Tax=Porospora cf. gigantea A TaxID=2853593 RepID=UPI003559C2D5|nr:MAG: hypothetical protein KVP18_002608 [Porospora cf. gigantea A]
MQIFAWFLFVATSAVRKMMVEDVLEIAGNPSRRLDVQVLADDDKEDVDIGDILTSVDSIPQDSIELSSRLRSAPDERILHEIVNDRSGYVENERDLFNE